MNRTTIRNRIAGARAPFRRTGPSEQHPPRHNRRRHSERAPQDVVGKFRASYPRPVGDTSSPSIGLVGRRFETQVGLIQHELQQLPEANHEKRFYLWCAGYDGHQCLECLPVLTRATGAPANLEFGIRGFASEARIDGEAVVTVIPRAGRVRKVRNNSWTDIARVVGVQR